MKPGRLFGKGGLRRTSLRRKAPDTTEKILDDLMRQVVFRRDDYRCLLCGKECAYTEVKKDGTRRFAGIQLAHVRTRRYKSIRWDPANAMTLCAGCHAYKWHAPPPGFDPLEWFRGLFPGRLEAIDARLQANIRSRRTLDRGLIPVSLEQELKRLR